MKREQFTAWLLGLLSEWDIVLDRVEHEPPDAVRVVLRDGSEYRLRIEQIIYVPNDDG